MIKNYVMCNLIVTHLEQGGCCYCCEGIILTYVGDLDFSFN